MKLFKQMTGQKVDVAPDEVVVQPNAQYQAEEAQKRRELQGCSLADFEMRVTLGDAAPPRARRTAVPPRLPRAVLSGARPYAPARVMNAPAHGRAGGGGAGRGADTGTNIAREQVPGRLGACGWSSTKSRGE